jgi:hypothetical protein
VIERGERTVRPIHRARLGAEGAERHGFDEVEPCYVGRLTGSVAQVVPPASPAPDMLRSLASALMM